MRMKSRAVSSTFPAAAYLVPPIPDVSLYPAFPAPTRSRIASRR